MSLHVDLSPEALAALERQKRNSTISAVIIAILSLVLIGLILGFIALKLDEKKPDKVVAYAAGQESTEQVTQRKVETSVERRPSAPSASTAKAIATNAVSPVAIPVPEVDVPDPSVNFGMGDDFGNGWGNGDGDGTGGGGGFAGIPATMQKRCTPEARLERLSQNGGTPQCEEAVVKALRWMKGTQQQDGSWTEAGHPVANTGLALLAYLGHCETPLSEEFGDTVLKAITFLIANSKKNGGALTKSTADKHWPYEHAICTYALAESYTFCKQLNISIPDLEETVKKAGELIISKQHSTSGGWDYNYDQSGSRGGDLSLVGWHVQALKACRHTGMEFDGLRGAMRDARKYVEARSNSEGGFGYSGSTGLGDWGYDTLTGVGVLSLQMMGRASSRECRAGLRYIEEKSKFDFNSSWADLYAHYYEGQACMNRGGKTWEHYNELFRDQILNNQNQDGSWKKPGGGNKLYAVAPNFDVNGHYRACLCTLMLEVYYRFLPGTGEKTRGH